MFFRWRRGDYLAPLESVITCKQLLQVRQALRSYVGPLLYTAYPSPRQAWDCGDVPRLILRLSSHPLRTMLY